MTAFATLLAVAMTGQIITQSMMPKEGDTIALIDNQPISGWTDPSLVDQPSNRTVRNGTLAMFVSMKPTRATRIARSRPYSNPAVPAGGMGDASVILRSRYPQLSPPAYYETVRLIGTNESFTCYNGPVWIVTNLEGAKTAYRDAASQLAKMKSKPRPPGNKKHASALAARDMAKLTKEIMARYTLSQAELNALMACGKANQWDASVPKPAKKEANR